MLTEDCPNCGLPTLVGQHYGIRMVDGEPVNDAQVRLDAMPVEAWERVWLPVRAQAWADGGQAPVVPMAMSDYVAPHRDADQVYVEHVCPLDLSRETSE